MDDGTKDLSSKVAGEATQFNNQIRVIHQMNAGVSCARITGLDATIGEHICFVDGDDYIMLDYVSYLLNLVFERDTDISVTTERC